MSTEQSKEYQREWREANKDKVREHSRNYKARNKEKLKEYKKKYPLGLVNSLKLKNRYWNHLKIHL